MDRGAWQSSPWGRKRAGHDLVTYTHTDTHTQTHRHTHIITHLSKHLECTVPTGNIMDFEWLWCVNAGSSLEQMDYVWSRECVGNLGTLFSVFFVFCFFVNLNCSKRVKSFYKKCSCLGMISRKLGKAPQKAICMMFWGSMGSGRVRHSLATEQQQQVREMRAESAQETDLAH